jgi:hypothetical protein
MPRIRTNANIPKRKPGNAETAAHSDYARIRDAAAWAGIGRSSLYKKTASGDVRIQKMGSRTLVELASLKTMLANLPEGILRNPA